MILFSAVACSQSPCKDAQPDKRRIITASNTAKGSETTAQAVKTAENVSDKVDALGHAASEISKVTVTIADIFIISIPSSSE